MDCQTEKYKSIRNAIYVDITIASIGACIGAGVGLATKTITRKQAVLRSLASIGGVAFVSTAYRVVSN